MTTPLLSVMTIGTPGSVNFSTSPAGTTPMALLADATDGTAARHTTATSASSAPRFPMLTPYCRGREPPFTADAPQRVIALTRYVKRSGRPTSWPPRAEVASVGGALLAGRFNLRAVVLRRLALVTLRADADRRLRLDDLDRDLAIVALRCSVDQHG